MAVVGVTVFKQGGLTPPPQGPTIAAAPGTAVGDLQALDKNDDMYANFDELDDLQVQPDVTANP